VKRRFWKFVHDRLEKAWHWVYVNKIAEPMPPELMEQPIRYEISYTCGAASLISVDLSRKAGHDEGEGR
jgi:predicted double-glycine peptidase